MIAEKCKAYWMIKNSQKYILCMGDRLIGDETKVLSWHSNNGVLKKYCFYTKLSSVIAKGAAEIKTCKI